MLANRKFFSQNVFKHLQERNLLYQISKSDLLTCSTSYTSFLADKPKIYIGFDPTAEAIHLGNLLGVLTALRFSQFGFPPVFIIGGATAKIGDPTGKSKARELLDFERVRLNIDKMTDNIRNIVNNVTSSNKFLAQSRDFPHVTPLYLNNEEFYKNSTLIDFLRETGIHFRMAQLISRETIKNRIHSSEGLSLSEFMYQTLQGSDYYYLYKRFNVKIQLGGSDQWGNMLAGQELVKKAASEEVISCTFPLLTTTSGVKFGKSEGNALFLDAKLTQPSKVYNYLVSTDDSQIDALLRQLTFLEATEIDAVLKKHAEETKKKVAQRLLAESVISLVYGEETAKQCSNGSLLFSNSIGEIEDLVGSCSSTKIGKEYRNCLFSKLCVDLKMVPTKAEFKRLVHRGVVFANDKQVMEDSKLDENFFLQGKYVVLKMGKKKVTLVEVESS